MARGSNARESGVFFRTAEHQSTTPPVRALPVQQLLWPIEFRPRSRPVRKTRTTAQQPREHHPQSLSIARHTATARHRLRLGSTTALTSKGCPRRQSGRQQSRQLAGGTRGPSQALHGRKWNTVAANAGSRCQLTQVHQAVDTPITG
jgi:hypothetical protein